MKNAFGSETTFHRNVALSFVIPSEAEGSAVFSVSQEIQGTGRVPLGSPNLPRLAVGRTWDENDGA
jgi:hypothetical protein